MEDHNLLESVLFYLLASVIAVPIFRRLGLGAILGYLTAGALIGPGGFHLVSNPTDALHFAEFGVVMLLFVIGLELAPEKLWRMRSQILMLGGGQLLISALLLGILFFFSLQQGGQITIVLALTLALSSTAFALQLMAERGIIASPLGRKGFSILLLQDMAVIPILILVQIWASSGSGTAEQASLTSVMIFVGSVVGILVASRYLLNPCLHIIALYGSREVMTAAALLIVLGMAVLMDKVGLSMGLGAFTAGIMLANSSFRHQLETDIEPFKGLLLGLFFIAVGMTLDLQLLVNSPLLIFGGALALMAVKTAVIACLVKSSGQGWREGVSLGLMLSQGGEFAFVVLSQALSLGFVENALSNQVVLTVGISMALTSPLVALWSRISATKPQDQSGEYDKSRDDSEPEVIIAGFGRFGQIIGRMLAASDIPFTALDKSPSHVDFVRRFGNKIFYGDGSRLDVLEAAGIAHARVLVVCVNSEDSLAIIETAKARYPDLSIVARAINRNHAYQLHALKVDHVFREYFASGLEAAEVTLSTLGYTDAQAIDKVEIFRNHDENLLSKAVEFKEDQAKLLELAQQGRKELESLFTEDEKL